jgi:hypothetical protein
MSDAARVALGARGQALNILYTLIEWRVRDEPRVPSDESAVFGNAFQYTKGTIRHRTCR